MTTKCSQCWNLSGDDSLGTVCRVCGRGVFETETIEPLTRYVIRKVWNTPKDRALADTLIKPGYRVRRRGRGIRRDRSEHQSINQTLATKLSYYIWKGSGHHYGAPINQYVYDMVGQDRATGKPRIRFIED